MKIPSLFRRSKNSAEDPVCHMMVEVDNPGGGIWQHDGKKYYFCGPGCNKSFQKEPHQYLSGEKKIDM